MKKVLWLSHLVPYPPKAGVLLRSYNLIKELSKNHEVTLIAFNQRSLCPDQKSIDEAVSHMSQFCAVHRIVNIDYDFSKTRKLSLILSALAPWSTYTVKWMKSKNFKEAVNELLQEENFDLIHVDTLSLIPYVEHLDVKKVLNHHNIESMMMLRRSKKETNLIKKFYFWQEGVKLRKYESRKCALFDLNLTCSSLDSKRLTSIAPDADCIDIPNGVDLRYFYSKSPAIKEKSLVFAGGLSWYPNIDAIKFFLASVWPILKTRVPDITLTIIGRNPPEWLVRLANLDGRINVTGFVDDVRPHIDSAHIYICPIRDGGGTKLKVLDALAMGKPLVADPVSCEGIDVTDQESVMFATTPQDYVMAIEKIIDSKDLCDKLSWNARELIEKKYCFEEIGSKLSKTYEYL